MHIATAAAFAGIGQSTFYDWLKRAEQEEEGGPHRAFSDTIKKALAQAEIRLVLQIAKAAETQWYAAAWLLERRWRQHWARNEWADYRG